ncbi:sulfotransferase domain-containing protein [Paenarthrobacter sp. PH39-S1]|uniref:sulfotransferase domain-containing protein n=1 Tax=Paenarthrobacter sp. PH39-S1 TaxID=3046204 RepID=UPI0024BB041A|nr:sulfotransferase domain-containing protein [Paenarthrobacter sp. PH39-S1]MDJ0356113.1 sulfotransferase domain-containing protein [Paenarthrobacter sp. PH39-S1]
MTTLSQLKDSSPRWLKDASDSLTRAYALRTAGSRPVPDFLIVGTKRGGTTSMFNYLLMHPGVLGLFPQLRGRKSTDYFFKERGRGDHWYRSHFHTGMYRKMIERRLGYGPVSGEASPYYLWDPRVAPQVQQLCSGVKAIALLRDPVERAWSHYQERVHNGVEPLSFEAALAAEDNRLAGEEEKMLADPDYYSSAHDFYAYRGRGVYLPQLQNWRASFPAERMLVLRSEDMYLDVQGTFDKVTDYLEIPRFALPNTKTFNAITQSKIPEGIRRELGAFYAPHNAELAEYLGRSPLWG